MQKRPEPRYFSYFKTVKGKKNKEKAWGYAFDGIKKRVEENIKDKAEPVKKRNQIRKQGFKTKAEAEAAAQKAIDEHFKIDGNNENLTVNDLFDRYINKCRANGDTDATITTYTSLIKKWCLSEIGNFKLENINRYHAEEIGNAIKTSGNASSTINKVIDTTKDMFEYAVKQEYIAKNPFNAVDHVKTREQVNPHKAFNKQEMQEILAAYKDEFVLYPYIVIANQTGMRRGEICGLTWDCVDFENKTITINKQLIRHPTDKQLYLDQPKCNSEGDIAISTNLVNFLKEYQAKIKRKKYSKDKDGKLISGNSFTFVLSHEDGTFVKPSYVSGRLADRKTKRGYPEFKTHDFRSTYATNICGNIDDAKYAQQQLRHKNASTTLNIYDKLGEERKKINDKKLDEIF